MNRLADESSPYLRQHADNPVDWYPWGAEAFARAEADDKPVLLSVGYSACHWCHVMAHESFEDAATAELMNRLFVNVKVDREERPDVDAIYMEATQAMTGHGGWPMTVFMTPSGQPFYCGTYFPRVDRHGQPGFARVCEAIDDAWRHRRLELLEQSDRLTEYIRRSAPLDASGDLPTSEVLEQAEQALVGAHDSRWGGFGHAPKFPQTMSIDLLLRRHRATGSPDALEVATHSLDAMAAGGIYDHIGGGFSRYSVDDHWLVPHFEKMLYDNALLIRPYLHAWQSTGEARHLQVVTETVEYVLRDLGQHDGGFYSAEDADSLDADGHSVEGAFYVWTLGEMRFVLGDDADDAIAWYGMTQRGNFEGANIVFRPIGEIERPTTIEASRALLEAARGARRRPGLDDKVLCEWNALMLSSLAEAAAATSNAAWTARAVRSAEFLCRELRRDDGRWMRSWQAGVGARHLAYAHDHAALVDAFTRVYELTGDPRWLHEATTTADALVALFVDEEMGGLFTTGTDGEALLARPKDLMDNATPSACSTAALALPRLAALTGRDDLRDVADAILRMLGPVAGRTPLAFGNLLAAIDQQLDGISEVVICGERPDLLAVARERWLPHAVLSWGEPLDFDLWQAREPGWAYVCRDHTCRQPVDTPDALRAQLLAPNP